MIRGIAIMGLNGCGKSTLAHEISKKLNCFEMDIEDYYFPEQKESRMSVFEHQCNAEGDHLGEIPFAMPRSKEEVQEMMHADIKRHKQFVISGVTMNWKADITEAIDVAFILEAPTDERVKRVQFREEIRFGSRVMPGGDMYEQQKEFRRIIADKSSQIVEDSANRLTCTKVKLNGVKSIDENVDIILRTIATLSV